MNPTKLKDFKNMVFTQFFLFFSPTSLPFFLLFPLLFKNWPIFAKSYYNRSMRYIPCMGLVVINKSQKNLAACHLVQNPLHYELSLPLAAVIRKLCILEAYFFGRRRTGRVEGDALFEVRLTSGAGSPGYFTQHPKKITHFFFTLFCY